MIEASPADHAEYQPALTWQAATPFEVAMAAAVAPRTEAVFARINHGRWIVDCPDCNSAQLGCVTDHRFMCSECANLAIGGLWRPVIWPEEIRDISAVVAARPDRRHQNTEPGETLSQLREQNAYLKAKAAGEDHPGGVGLHPHHPGKASLHEGHTHAWPKQVKPDKVYTCPGCGEDYSGLAIEMGRRQ